MAGHDQVEHRQASTTLQYKNLPAIEASVIYYNPDKMIRATRHIDLYLDVLFVVIEAELSVQSITNYVSSVNLISTHDEHLIL